MADGIALALQPASLLFGVFGVLLGIVFGAIPGLSATLGIALLLPVTLLVPPEQGLIMLGGVYAGGIYGGSISAILLNIPGTSAAVITAMEGNVMARRGEAPLALGLSATASGVGGIVSAFALLWLTPELARLALEFAAAEYVALILFSLVIVSVMLPTPLLGNAAGAALGLTVALIGLDPYDGTPRFTFGFYQLASGAPLLPLLIGFFAMPQVLVLAVETLSGRKVEAVVFARTSGYAGILREAVVHWATLVRSTIVGIFLGILPAIGPESTPITTHALERRFAKKPETFGKGSIQGLIAAECSNNANVGGSLIPLLALGIPGSAAAAVFIGGLEVHGLRPGPLLFREQPVVMGAFFTGFIIVNIMMMLLGLFAARYMAIVLRIPKGVIATFVALFALFGGYTAGNSIFYVWVLLVATLASLALRAVRIPILPVALGFILGTLFEEQLAIMLTSFRSADAILGRPIAMTLIALTLAVLGFFGWRRGWK